MKCNLEKLLLIMTFLNDHSLFTTFAGFIISLPFAIFTIDGFVFSKNRFINIWQKCNIVLILFLLLILFVNIISLDTVYNTDGSEDKKDPHAKIIENVIKAGRALGDKLGDGAAAGGGIAGMAKLIPKSAPMPVKGAAIFGGGVAGVVGKRAGQAFSDIVFKSVPEAEGSGNKTGASSSSNNSSTRGQSSNNNNNNCAAEYNDNSVGPYGSGRDRLISDNLNDLDNSNLNDLDNSTLFNNLIYSPNDSPNEGFIANLLELFNSDNKVEVLLSSILILNIIKLIMVLFIIITLCSYYLINLDIELKFLVRFNLMSESLRSKIVNIINYVLKIFSKSIFLNVIILFSVILFCDIQSIYLLNNFINHLETMCDYFIKFKS